MRRLATSLAALVLLVAACGDSGDPVEEILESGTLPATTVSDQQAGTTITVPAGDGSDITVIEGSLGGAVIEIGGDTYSVPLNECVITATNLVVSGETDEIAFGLVTGVGLAMTVNPNTPSDSVAYIVAAPDVTVSGNSVTGSGEVEGVTAAGFGDPEPWSISINC